MICRKDLTECRTPGMCSPHGGCPGIDVEAGRKLAAENDRLFKLLERMIDQMLPVEELKDMPGYNRVLTAETLLVERDQLKAENEALRKDADRYRWLCDGHGYFMEEEMLCHITNEKAAADFAIDARILEESGQ